MKRLKTILLYSLLPLTVFAQNSGLSANDVLRQFLSKIDGETLSSAFTLTVSQDATQPLSYTGNLKMWGNNFRLSMLGNEGAFDGKTYYLYSEETNELTLTTPTPQELLEANPILFARELYRRSTARFSAANKDAKRYVIELVPNNQNAGIRKFVIKLLKNGYVPEEITVKEDAQTTVLRFSEAVFSSQIPSFVISKPGAFVNDLR